MIDIFYSFTYYIQYETQSNLTVAFPLGGLGWVIFSSSYKKKDLKLKSVTEPDARTNERTDTSKQIIPYPGSGQSS